MRFSTDPWHPVAAPGARQPRSRAIADGSLAAPPAWLAAVLLATVVGVAIVLRFWDLASNPGGLYTDEAAEAYSAWRLLHVPNFYPVWFDDGGGREALFAYFVAAAFRLGGETVEMLRVTAAAWGVAGVLAIWMLARRFGEWTALAAAAWAAGSLWLVCISRDGMRNTIVPFFGAVALLSLLVWSARPSRWTASLAGGLLAVAALYTYQPLKLVPLVAILWLAWLRRADRPAYDRLRPGFLPAIVAFAVVAAPMLAVAVTNPTNYFGRIAGTSPFNPEVDATDSPAVHVLRTLGMFAITGDPNARHDVAGLPLLGWPLTLVAVAGAVRLWRRRRDARHALILISLPVFVLPPLLAIEGGSPHFLRALGLAAPLGVTIGLGCVEIVEHLGPWLRRLRPRARIPHASAIAGLAFGVGFAALAGGSAFAYFGRPVADRYDAYKYDLTAMAEAADRVPGSAVVVNDYDATVIRFLVRAPVTIVAPGTIIPDPTVYPRIFAVSRTDLLRAINVPATVQPQPVASDPGGNPRVWALSIGIATAGTAR